MYHQIYSYVKEEILSGRLSCGEKLPSARELAGYLSVSRNPVDKIGRASCRERV